MSDERILFRGARVAPHWPARIRAAQTETTCMIGGVEMPRVRYGDDLDDWGAKEQPCHDCAVIKGG